MQGGETTGIVAQIGLFLVKAGGALVDHIALLFAVGVGVGMSENNNGTGALASLASWLIITTLLRTETVTAVFPAAASDENSVLAFSKIENPFIGILCGMIGSTCFNRFQHTQLPDWLSFFSGKRCVTIIAGLVSILVSAALLFVWPLTFRGLTALGNRIAGLGPVGAGLYAFLNRLLIPFGLHHALNNVFWFDTIGLGDLTHFWAGQTSADVSWSLGMYMSGFFPCMMFGIPGAALAVIRSAKPEKRKATMGIMLSCAVCAFVCGVTEPFEFAFVFLCPPLFLVYALLYGLITILTVLTGFRAGFCFSGGVTDLIFSASLPAAERTWMILPLGLLSFVLFYAVFRLAAVKWNAKLPGREDDEETNKTETGVQKSLSDNPYSEKARAVLIGLGGADNLLSVDHCITRLRLEVKNTALVDENRIKSAGIPGVIKTGKNAVQVVIGTSVQFVADELRRLCELSATAQQPEGRNPVQHVHRMITHHDDIFEDDFEEAQENSFTFTVTKKTGIHAHPAGAIAEIAKEYACEVSVSTGEKTCSARSVTGLMALNASEGTQLTVRTEGADAQKALKAICEYMKENL